MILASNKNKLDKADLKLSALLVNVTEVIPIIILIKTMKMHMVSITFRVFRFFKGYGYEDKKYPNIYRTGLYFYNAKYD
ncbi:MAG: hypothetical protein SCARUB_02695 [Candidatus Scalindua rubra]|uniref:Uncharacterized protein n=1 Tax=Candidatus Scalindua rubra TaxID=1872076 RepID=A0A1E3X973_9BACT|nr:MAG: hypothetical protein SCARUB_02695 [Candidatus Scalindua rubra]